jgi:16S rRNA (cytosine967-C5)-methyltransferase
MTISAARKIAYEILRCVEAEGAYASDLLHAALAADVKAEDASLATELVLGVLRWRRLLDFVLERHLNKPVARLDLPVALALRLGLYQLRCLERIPARAAVNESVELVRRARKASATALVNAILRRAAKEAGTPATAFLPAQIARAERLGILYAHPTWMVERWLERFGEERTTALLVANNHAPRLSCMVHDSTRQKQIWAELRDAGLRIEPGQILQSALAVSGGSPSRTQTFRRGGISIQDEASQIVPLLLNVRAGQRVLDLCAAPGGKTAALVRAASLNGFVAAADVHWHRLRAMREHFKRLRLRDVRLVKLDGTAALPFGIEFDRILVDAPCSGTGTLARHPEIRWRLRAEQLSEFHSLQTRLLRSAIERLGSGGRIVYSTCSLEPEENELVVEEVLRRVSGVKRVGARELAGALGDELMPGVAVESLFDSEGQFHTLPGAHNTDGFFAAGIVRGA